MLSREDTLTLSCSYISAFTDTQSIALRHISHWDSQPALQRMFTVALVVLMFLAAYNVNSMDRPLG